MRIDNFKESSSYHNYAYKRHHMGNYFGKKVKRFFYWIVLYIILHGMFYKRIRFMDSYCYELLI